MTAIDIARSIFKFTDNALNIHSADVANAQQDGATKTLVHATTISSEGSAIGIDYTISHYVNPKTQRSLRNYSGEVSYKDALAGYLQNIYSLVGSKGAQKSLNYQVSDNGKVAHNLTVEAKENQKLQFIESIQKTINYITTCNNELTKLQYEADGDIATKVVLVNQKIELLAKKNIEIAQLASNESNNVNAAQIIKLEDERNQLAKDLNDLMDVTVELYKEGQLNIKTSNGRYLVFGGNTFGLSFTPALPGGALNGIIYNGSTDITNEITKGSLKGLVQIRDSYIPGEIAKLDNFAKVYADSVNAIHNTGTSLDVPNSLSSTTGVPGFVGPLTAASVVSGTGTVRFAVVDNSVRSKSLVNYYDMPLANNMTIQNIIDNINGAAVGLTASLSAGSLVITATDPNHGVAMGEVSGSATPKLSSGAVFSAGNSSGFSHFFGFNNIINTGTYYPGDASTGFSSILSVNSAFPGKGGRLAIHQLINHSPPTLDVVAVPEDALKPAEDLYKAFSINSYSFPAAGGFATVGVTMKEYGQMISSSIIETEKNNRQALKQDEISLKEAARINYQESGINPKEKLMEMKTINELRSIGAKILKLVTEANEMLDRIIFR